MNRRKASKGANPRHQRRGPSLDEDDVWHWFARDPRACVAHTAARKIIRGLEHTWRQWFLYPTPQEINSARTASEKREIEERQSAVRENHIRRQHIPWWQDLRDELVRVETPVSLADRFADYLSGYVTVRDREQVKTEGGRATPQWRRTKRFLKELNLPPSPTTAPPHRQSLKTTLTNLMVGELQRHGASLAKAAQTVNSVWRLIGEASDEFDSGSLARAVRRARHRAKPTK